MPSSVRLLLSDCSFWSLCALATAGTKKVGIPGNKKLHQRQEDLQPEMGKAQEK